MTEEFDKILDKALQLRKLKIKDEEIIERFPAKYHAQLLENLKLASKLESLKEIVTPTKDSFERMLFALPEKDVTNFQPVRYDFSMWKYVVAVVVIALGMGFIFLKHNQVNPGNQTTQLTKEVPNQPVTEKNAEATFQQTDQAIEQVTIQMDQDLKTLDSTGGEDDLTNI